MYFSINTYSIIKICMYCKFFNLNKTALFCLHNVFILYNILYAYFNYTYSLVFNNKICIKVQISKKYTLIIIIFMNLKHEDEESFLVYM
jgi:hypothetical protein